uniref:Uncharacterized protein n=1 Tax=Tetraselmis sp. GSL018 TaxID=582737 RepID=A0A061REP7_9CHLO
MGGAGARRHQIQISDNDSNEKVEKQWTSLLRVLNSPESCVIYHLENHYSLVYGVREWTVDVGYAGSRNIRQVLLARPGQRPCTWIDFETVRQTMLRWGGYCMVGITALGHTTAIQGSGRPPPANCQQDAAADSCNPGDDITMEEDLQQQANKCSFWVSSPEL